MGRGGRRASARLPHPTLGGGAGMSLVVAACCLLVLVVFLLPANRLDEGYDWFQVWRYHKEFIRSSILDDGQIPLWSRWSFSGRPFLADPQTMLFYPPSLLYVLLPAGGALPLDALFHFSLAGVGMYLFCRARGMRPWACVFAGVAYAGCGFNLAHTSVGHIQYYAGAAWLPIVFLCVERWAAGGRALWIAAGAAAVAVQLFAGAPQVSWMTCLFAALYGAGRLAGRARAERGQPEGRPLRRAALGASGLAALFALGLLLSAAQLLPAWELSGLSVREKTGYDYSASLAMPPDQAAHLLAPGRLGKARWEVYGYLGLAPLALAASAFSIRRERRGATALPGLLCALAMLLIMGGETPLFRLAYHALPGLSLFRAHVRELLVAGFFLIVLAASTLSDAQEDGSPGGERRRRARIVAGAILGGAAVLLTISRADAGPLQPLELLWLAAACCALACGCFFDTARRWAPAALCGLLWLDVVLAERVVRERITVPAGTPPAQESLAAALKAETGDQGLYRFWFPRRLFLSNEGYLLRRSAVEGYENLILERYRGYIHAMTGAPVKPEVLTILTQSNFEHASGPFPFKALNVRLAAMPDGRGGYKLWSNPDPPGPAFLVDSWELLPGPGVLERMREPDFDPRRVALLEDPPDAGPRATAAPAGQDAGPRATAAPAGQDAGPRAAAAPAGQDAGSAGRVRVLECTANRVAVDVEAAREGILVLSEVHYPGWVARVDGRPRPVLRADYLLRAVRVEAGRHRVEFVFSSPSLRRGLAVSACALAACAGIAFASWRRRAAQVAPAG